MLEIVLKITLILGMALGSSISLAAPLWKDQVHFDHLKTERVIEKKVTQIKKIRAKKATTRIALMRALNIKKLKRTRVAKSARKEKPSVHGESFKKLKAKSNKTRPTVEQTLSQQTDWDKIESKNNGSTDSPTKKIISAIKSLSPTKFLQVFKMQKPNFGGDKKTEDI